MIYELRGQCLVDGVVNLFIRGFFVRDCNYWELFITAPDVLFYYFTKRLLILRFLISFLVYIMFSMSIIFRVFIAVFDISISAGFPSTVSCLSSLLSSKQSFITNLFWCLLLFSLPMYVLASTLVYMSPLLLGPSILSLLLAFCFMLSSLLQESIVLFCVLGSHLCCVGRSCR